MAISTKQKLGVLQNIKTSQTSRESKMRSQGKMTGPQNMNNIVRAFGNQSKVHSKMKKEASNRMYEILRGK